MDNHFVCSSKDCNLRFSSEDTLQLHTKRHEMVLSLGKNNLPSSDQTPTPIRFIRQCEEIGLFQDLQNVNPFEETFRKAAEAVKKGSTLKPQSTSILSRTPNDDLHTPHIFPDEMNIETNISNIEVVKDCSIERNVEEVVVRTEADTSLKTNAAINLSPPVTNDRVSTTVSATESVVRNHRNLFDTTVTNEEFVRAPTLPTTFTNTISISDSSFNVSNDPVQVLLRMPNGSLVQLATKPVPSTVVPVSVTPSQVHIEEAVKILPKTSITNGGTVILAAQGFKRQSQPQHLSTNVDVKQKLKQHLGNTSKAPKQSSSQSKTPSTAIKSDTATKKTKADESNMDETEKEKRRKILERNRNAAIRCRERRKRWIEDLRKKAESMAVNNRGLNEEICSLKAEVAHLRTLLLAHANCPVTLAQVNPQETTTVCIPREVNDIGSKRPRRDGLTLDIEQAKRAAAVPTIELDTPTPTIVRSDKVLSSVAPPATPEQDRLVTFTDILTQERSSEINEEIIEDRHLSTSISSGTTVIQINPNAVRPSQGFS